MIGHIELKEVLKRSATNVETLHTLQEDVQRNFAVSLVRVRGIFLEQITVRVKTKTRRETMEIEDHQEDMETEENLMIEEEDLRVMVVIGIEEEDPRVMVEKEDHQGDMEMTDIDLRVQKENMIQQEELRMRNLPQI